MFDAFIEGWRDGLVWAMWGLGVYCGIIVMIVVSSLVLMIGSMVKWAITQRKNGEK